MRFLTKLLAALALEGIFAAPVGAVDRPADLEAARSIFGGGNCNDSSRGHDEAVRWRFPGGIACGARLG